MDNWTTPLRLTKCIRNSWWPHNAVWNKCHKCSHSVLLDKWAISIKHVSSSLFVVSTCAVASFVSPMWNQPASESTELYRERQHFEVHRSRQVNLL